MFKVFAFARVKGGVAASGRNVTWDSLRAVLYFYLNFYLLVPLLLLPLLSPPDFQVQVVLENGALIRPGQIHGMRSGNGSNYFVARGGFLHRGFHLGG